MEQNLTFLGLVAMIDPPRHEVPKPLRAAAKPASARHDHRRPSAHSPGHRPLIGLAPKETPRADGCPVIEGHQVETMSDEAASARPLIPASPHSFDGAPAQMIVSTLRDGEVVAVTGDGVNAPAIKKPISVLRWASPEAT